MQGYVGAVRGYSGASFGAGYTTRPSNYSVGRIYTSAPRYSSVAAPRYQHYSPRSNAYGGPDTRNYSPTSAGQRVYHGQLASRPGADRAANVWGSGNAMRSRSAAVGTTSLGTSTNVTPQDTITGSGNWARNNPTNLNRFDRQTQDRLRNWQGNRSSWAEANKRHSDNHGARDDGHQQHDRNWWHHHCDTIVWVNWGWWAWWDGWWYPAWGYDSYSSYYPYDGPIYGYDGLPPDEAVANVQSELQRLGYYYGPIDGILSVLTRDALMRYQNDQGLPVTGGIDAETVNALGLE